MDFDVTSQRVYTVWQLVLEAAPMAVGAFGTLRWSTLKCLFEYADADVPGPAKLKAGAHISAAAII